MANLLVKEISTELLAEVNYAARMAGKTQREWVIEILERATSSERTEKRVRKGEGQATGAKVDEPKRGRSSAAMVEADANAGQDLALRGVGKPAPAKKQEVCKEHGYTACAMCNFNVPKGYKVK